MVHDMIHKPGAVSYVRQQDPAGLGHAVWCARNMVRDEPVAILLADDLILGQSCIAEMVAHYQGGNMVAAMNVPTDQTQSYGIITPAQMTANWSRSRGLLKNQSPKTPHRTLPLLAAI